MKNIPFKMLCGFTALLMLSFVLPGFAGDSSLQVKCIDSSDNPLPNVKVVAFHLNSQKAKEKKSDAKGIADFTKMDDGVYQVVGRKDGFAPALYEYASLKGSQESVSLKFTAGADKKLYFEDQAGLQKAMSLLQQGGTLYQEKKFADAEKAIRESLELNPSSPNTLYYLAVTFLQQAKFEETVDVLNQLIRLTGILLSLPAQQDAAVNQQFNDKAKQLLKQLPGIKGDNALQKKQFDAAAALYLEALKTDPDNPDLYYNMSLALGNANKYDDAIKGIDKAIALKPAEKAYADLKKALLARKEKFALDAAQSIMDEGIKLLDGGNAAEALQKFEEVRGKIAQDKQAPVWRYIARAQVKLNQTDAAVESFKKAITLAPAEEAEKYRNSFAQFYLDSKKYNEALDVLGDSNLVNLAKRVKDKEPQLAKAALERVIKNDPQNLDACFDLGEQYYMDKENSRAKELLEKYLQSGKDTEKLDKAKNMMVILNKRLKQ